MIDWFIATVIAYLLYRNFQNAGRIENLEQLIRSMAIQANTSEMNVKKLFYLRSTELITKDPKLTSDELSELKQEFENETAELAERNKILLRHK